MRLLTRDGCHLCDDALAVVSQVCGQLDVTWETLDIDEDAGLRARYTDHVPVVLIDGRLHGYWFVDDESLRRDLTQAVASPPPRSRAPGVTSK